MKCYKDQSDATHVKLYASCDIKLHSIGPLFAGVCYTDPQLDARELFCNQSKQRFTGYFCILNRVIV